MQDLSRGQGGCAGPARRGSRRPEGYVPFHHRPVRLGEVDGNWRSQIATSNPAANMGILNIQSSTRPPQRTPIQCKYGAFGKGEQRRALQRTWGKYIGIPSSTYVFESFRCIPFMTRSPSVPKGWSVVTYVQVAPRSRRSPSWKWIAPLRISAVANASAISSFRHPWKSA